MKVHVQTGRVEFAGGSIERGMSRDGFLASGLGRKAQVFVENEPYMTYRIRPEPGVTVTLSFNGPTLESVGWLFDLPPDKERHWTEELEQERKRLHDEWLARELGEPPYRYPWGNLTSEYDSKGCASDIILNYAT
jgi:hypothetical protein